MERKRITNSAKLFLQIYNVGLFSYIWITYYNHFCFHLLALWGGLTSILTYFIVYNWLCNTFKAFGIASYRVTETVFSQFLAFGLADLLLYIECCLINNNYVSIRYGLIILGVQLIGTTLLISCTKQCYMLKVPPKATLYIFGEDTSYSEIENFSKRLENKYNHLFMKTIMISENTAKEQLHRLIEKNETIILYEVSDSVRKEVMDYAINHKKTIYLTPSIMDLVIQGCSPRHLLDTPLMKYDYPCEKHYRDIVKRLADICMASIALMMTMPLMLIIALAIKLEDRGPIFYQQERYTEGFAIFKILKFRSMVVDAEKNGFQPCTKGDNRITKVGRVIRPFRLDELPQLLNILVGDMSFVGPRPERIEHVEKYMEDMPEFRYRLRVKGGLTGYAQVFGKYNTTPYDKLRLDLMYIENRSLLLDSKIILMTLKILFSKESTEGFEKERSDSRFAKV